jgi:hypothetical protein
MALSKVMNLLRYLRRTYTYGRGNICILILFYSVLFCFIPQVTEIVSFVELFVYIL